MCLHKQALKCVFANEYSFQNPEKLLDELLMVAKTFETTKIQTELWEVAWISRNPLLKTDAISKD